VTSRVLSLLACFDEENRQLSLSEIARGAALPLSTTHRLLAELESWRAVERLDDGSYVIGQRLWQLGMLATIQRELGDIALPAMQDLYEATRENVHLAVRQDTTALYVERVYGKDSVSVASRVGRPLPLHATGVGKVLLAHAPRPILQFCMENLAPVTRYTITEPARMAKELAAVRANGYARAIEEMTLGTFAISVPVHDGAGLTVAALGLVTSTRRRDLEKFIPALRLASATITRGMPLVL
jgi:DNA-binding IclR family transcriptional regulator